MLYLRAALYAFLILMVGSWINRYDIGHTLLLAEMHFGGLPDVVVRMSPTPGSPGTRCKIADPRSRNPAENFIPMVHDFQFSDAVAITVVIVMIRIAWDYGGAAVLKRKDDLQLDLFQDHYRVRPTNATRFPPGRVHSL